MFRRFKKSQDATLEEYKLEVIRSPEECDDERRLPDELRYLFIRYPEYKDRVKQLIKSGKAIGVRTLLRTPDAILKAVHTVSVHSQKNYIVTWLPKLLRDKHHPKLTDADRREATGRRENLDEAIETILRDRLRFKQIVLVDEGNQGVTPKEEHFVAELSELIYPIAVDYCAFRVVSDNARERTKIAQTIIKTLLIIGPIAHLLEKFASGIGKVFAASADDLIGESAELMALRGSGFSWRELAKRSRILVPVFILATWGAFSVHGLIEEGRLIVGGIVFGMSAVALSLTTAIQSIFMYRKNLLALIREGKVPEQDARSVMRLSFVQDFTNPARLGLILGASLAPFAGIAGALLHLMDNGWVLAAIGSTESVVAGLTVILANPVSEWRFHRRLKRITAAGYNEASR